MSEREAENMQKAIENYANELAEEYVKEYVNKQAAECVKRMLDHGITLEKALGYAEIDLQTYEKYSAKLQ